ncbi:hypothetical protein M2S00_03560 [Apilactobacillus sp. TMW 2.2459]|uniref:hypothetical protein n=1 Tax=Apilactobacillus xinyiensis TaxID=2841032 RepID=UPI001C7E1C70|nr:hypothetical protein [Apilactobacillus xinyiensis]MCL0312176.1 hypothetical protein [Apilactobacillus xinyiensis]
MFVILIKTQHKLFFLTIFAFIISYVIFINVFWPSMTINAQLHNILYSNSTTINKYCNAHTAKYLLKNRHQRLQKMTDNQGSGDICYYCGQFGHQSVGIYGIINDKGLNALLPQYKITNIKIY